MRASSSLPALAPQRGRAVATASEESIATPTRVDRDGRDVPKKQKSKRLNHRKIAWRDSDRCPRGSGRASWMGGFSFPRSVGGRNRSSYRGIGGSRGISEKSFFRGVRSKDWQARARAHSDGGFSATLPPPPPAHQISKSYPRPALELPGDPHSNLDANPIACQAWFQTSASLHGVLHSAACLFATGQVQRVSVWQLRKNTRAESKI